MTDRDRTEFIGYLRNCTDAQVIGVWKKEIKAERTDYARLAEAEAERRDISFDLCRIIWSNP